MGLTQNNNSKIEDFSLRHFLAMFLGFLVFISGLFLVAYSLFAWLFVANILQSVVYFVLGFLACFLGRKLIRKVTKKQYIANIVE